MSRRELLKLPVKNSMDLADEILRDIDVDSDEEPPVGSAAARACAAGPRRSALVSAAGLGASLPGGGKARFCSRGGSCRCTRGCSRRGTRSLEPFDGGCGG